MTWTSTVPAAIDGLVAAFGAIELTNGAVVDGPRVGSSTLMEVLIVGWTGDDSPEAVAGTSALASYTTSRQREQYTVTCAASVLRGSGQMSAARARAFELYGAAAGILAGDKTLGGVVMSARPAEINLMQSQDTRGAVATVVFAVDVDGFTGT